jgi:hypothetical protein
VVANECYSTRRGAVLYPRPFENFQGSFPFGTFSKKRKKEFNKTQTKQESTKSTIDD